MSSVMKTLMNWRPLCTSKFVPTNSGTMVQRRAQVLMTRFSLAVLSASIFFESAASSRARVRRQRLGLLRLARLGLAGEQVSDVAHQLSQPLFAIMAHVTSARTRLEAQAGAGRALADLECIESAAGKAADIVGCLKKLSVELCMS